MRAGSSGLLDGGLLPLVIGAVLPAVPLPAFGPLPARPACPDPEDPDPPLIPADALLMPLAGVAPPVPEPAGAALPEAPDSGVTGAAFDDLSLEQAASVELANITLAKTATRDTCTSARARAERQDLGCMAISL